MTFDRTQIAIALINCGLTDDEIVEIMLELDKL